MDIDMTELLKKVTETTDEKVKTAVKGPSPLRVIINETILEFIEENRELILDRAQEKIKSLKNGSVEQK